ncbi:ABC transporter substrate-binding protein [Streptomyces sp. SL13]|jgi:osmoprotectant transport system substrate-binding protein|uniref:ABC transporter substrate-binding protein n=1 Tax=Streptantibioticus silvisoli TaxID=2705255 RepID=A0AA90K875_9ACTN|nr:ABC transporter substrate-binding protein [Streptantibioticus silvisoli]MDI5962875.1 ABC transporter substrate-binding protein [Streptantibioticus silvisoli]MDI5969703.1 ABC transporter substrate-binding protein [Streptantibioticus silvisoli]
MSKGLRGIRAAGAVATAMVLAGSLSACGNSLEGSGSGSATKSGSGSKGSLVIGSAGFTESTVLAQMYAQLLNHAGYKTSIKTVSNRELYEPALEKGQIDVVPEYAATMAEFLNDKVNGANAKPVASPDVKATVAALSKLATPRGLKVLPAGQAVDQNAFAVSKTFAAKYHLKSLSDLGAAHVPVKLAAGDECPDRPFCEPGLKKTYHIDVTGIDPKGVGTTQSKAAVKAGTDQLVLTTTTDATLPDFNLVLLQDDKKLQNADYVLPIVNAKHAGNATVANALDKLTKVLTTADLTKLDDQVDGERQKPSDVATAYLKAKGLV